MDSNFLAICKNCGNAEQYFFPNEISSWKDEKDGKVYKMDDNFSIQPHINGIRLNEYDSVDKSIESKCQYDLSKAFRAIQELRKNSDFKTLILSNDFVKGKQNEDGKGRRIRLGLFISKDGKFAEDTTAAKACYKQIKKVIKKSGFHIEESKDFNNSDGMDGLCEWASTLKLKRKNNLWLIFLFFLLLLFFILPISSDNIMFNMPINTNSYIFIIDTSMSMTQTIKDARSEVKRNLDELLEIQKFFSTYYVDIISYTDTPNSALKEMTKLNNNNAGKLNEYMDDLETKIRSGNTLKNAIKLAADEVKKHNYPTTLLIITDAEQDDTIQYMINNISDVKDWFGDTEFYVSSATPRALRHLKNSPDKTYKLSEEESNLEKLSQGLNGNFIINN